MSADDEALRTRLRALAGHELLPQLDDAARARAARRARAQLLARRGRGRLALGLLAAALPLALIAYAGLREPARTERAAVTATSPSVASGPTMRAAQPPTGACDAQADLPFAIESDAARLELGTRALFVAAPGTEVAATLAANCDVRAKLEAGSLSIHARRLEGAALVVSTPRGEVRVKGTVFQVDFDTARNALLVGVEEGRVVVETPGGESRELLPGQALRVASALSLEPFSATSRARLRRSLGLSVPTRARSENHAEVQVQEPVPAQPDPTPRAWRSGNLAPPALPPEPGTSVMEDGRPMSKPKLTQPNEATHPHDRPGDAP